MRVRVLSIACALALAIGVIQSGPARAGRASGGEALSFGHKTTTPATLSPEEARFNQELQSEVGKHLAISIAIEVAVSQLEAAGMTVTAGTLSLAALPLTVVTFFFAFPLVEAPEASVPAP